LRACLGDESAGFHEIFEGLLDVLVVDIELILEGVQFGVVENFPPFAVQHGSCGCAIFHWPAGGFSAGNSL